MKPIRRIAMVAGEASGDILGAGLMSALRVRFPDCTFEGIGGLRMLDQGFQSHFPLERLSVMGLVEPLKRLPELLSIRSSLRKRYLADPPDIFIGIDSPDFNLSLEEDLKKSGVFTVHYVSPSVWAWRQGRTKKIARAVDLMLTLLPFEAKFYREHNVPVAFIGHPLADEIPMESSTEMARKELGLDEGKKYIAILPGSRRSEVEKLCTVFLAAAMHVYEKENTAHFLIPAVNSSRYEEINSCLRDFPSLPATVLLGKSQQVMAASELVLMASGTTTLEALLLKKPMIIAYRLAWLTYAIASRLVKIDHIGLPNLLAGKQVVPEFIQSAVTPDALANSIMHYLNSPESRQEQTKQFSDIHKDLQKNASMSAAEAILDVWQQKNGY